MKFTNQKIENMQNVLTVIGNKEIDNPVLALKIARNNYNLTQALNPVLKVKNDILRKYGEKDEKGKIVMDEDGRIRITDIVDLSRNSNNYQSSIPSEWNVDAECPRRYSKVFVYYNCVFTSTEKSNFVAVGNLVEGGTCITGKTVTIL